MTTTTVKTIKFVVYNPITRRNEEVLPDDDFTLIDVIPLFKSGEKWVTVPGWHAGDVYHDWLRQFGYGLQSS